jgi:molybdenum-dependent DNA-binding transcriptional regulator ModE
VIFSAAPITVYAVSGRKKKATDEQMLRAVACSPDVVATAQELLPLVPYQSRAGVLDRLNDLYEQGLIAKKEVGSAATVWWLTDDGRRLLYEKSQSDTK